MAVDILYNHSEIDHVSIFKYLGTSLDHKLSWKDHVAEEVTKMQNRLSIIKRL